MDKSITQATQMISKFLNLSNDFSQGFIFPQP